MVVALETGFFSLFFSGDLIKWGMDVIMGKRGGCLFRSIEEKNQNTYAEKDKKYIDGKQFTVFRSVHELSGYFMYTVKLMGHFSSTKV